MNAPRVVLTSAVLAAVAALPSCGDDNRHGPDFGPGEGMSPRGRASRKGVTALEPGVEIRARAGQTIYAPVYSHIYISNDAKPFNLAATLSIRNADQDQPIILTLVRYNDSEGQVVHDYLARRLRLAPLASMEFFVAERDTRGGAGASFLVEWVSEQEVNAPVVEVVMIGTASTQGISFVSPGRVIKEWSRDGTRSRAEGDSRSGANKVRQHESRSSRRGNRGNLEGSVGVSDRRVHRVQRVIEMSAGLERVGFLSSGRTGDTE